MLETIFERPGFLKRHQEAPLPGERERFLLHLHKQGTSRPALRTLARELIHVVRLRELKSLRDVGRCTELQSNGVNFSARIQE